MLMTPLTPEGEPSGRNAVALICTNPPSCPVETPPLLSNEDAFGFVTRVQFPFWSTAQQHGFEDSHKKFG